MNSQRLPSTATTAAFCTGSPGGNLPAAASAQRGSDVVRGCEASARGDSRHGAGRNQAGTRLVWWCQRRQQAAQISAAAASGFVVSHAPCADAAEHISTPSLTSVIIGCMPVWHGACAWLPLVAVRAFSATQRRNGPAEGHARHDTHVRHGRRPPCQRTGIAGISLINPPTLACLSTFPCSTRPCAPDASCRIAFIWLYLQAGFKELFGDRYAVDVVDLATQHSPFPFNQASRSYNTMVSMLATQATRCDGMRMSL